MIIRYDFNWHIDSSRLGYKRTHDGYGIEDKNAIGEIILDFAMSHDFAIINTYVKKQEHLLACKKMKQTNHQ